MTELSDRQISTQPLLGLSGPNKKCLRDRDLSDENTLLENIRTFEQNRKEG